MRTPVNKVREFFKQLRRQGDSQDEIAPMILRVDRWTVEA